MYDAKVWLKFVTSRSAARAVAIGLAGFAFVWAVLRACVQALTGDEAQDYMFYAGKRQARRIGTGIHGQQSHAQFDAGADVHLLLGLSAFSVRIPTLIGAAIYIYAIYWLCRDDQPGMENPDSAIHLPGLQSVHFRFFCGGARLWDRRTRF